MCRRWIEALKVDDDLALRRLCARNRVRATGDAFVVVNLTAFISDSQAEDGIGNRPICPGKSAQCVPDRRC